jgi:chloride channel protein, CIC family
MIIKGVGNIIRLLKDRLTERQFQVFAAVIVGLCAGVMAFILKTFVHHLQSLFQTDKFFSPIKSPYMIAFPLLGIVLTTLFVQKILRGQLGKGISDVLYEIAKKSAFVQRHKLYSHIITSSLTVGLGGSAGLEAPIVITGSAVGSNLARSWQLSYKDRTLLLGCGAAAGIAAVFNSPIAGVMFAMEVLLTDVTFSAFIPLIIAAAVGALFSKIVFNEDVLFFFRLTDSFNYLNIPYYIVLALACGFISLYYIRVAHSINKFFKTLEISPLSKALVGGIFLAGMIYVFPSLFGEGYAGTKIIADGQSELLLKNSLFSEFRFQKWAIVAFVAAIVVIKPIATTVTLASGGNGGNFAPSLFVGAHVGFVFSRIINNLGFTHLPEGNFSIVAMGGILSGVMYAPLTGIFLIAEVTGGYELIIPLMIVSTLSNVLVRHFEPVSLETKNMIERGDVFSRDKDRNILLLLKTSNIIETDFKTIPITSSLGDIVQVIKTSKRNLFAVVDKDGKLEGILTLDDIREVMFDVKLYQKLFVEDLLKTPPAVIHVNEDMSAVMKKFDTTNSWNLPVVDVDDVYVGFISKSNIFSNYREQLKMMQDEL